MPPGLSDVDKLKIDKLKILFLSADPSDSTRLRLPQELRDIREQLQRSKERDKFVLESRECLRPRDISQAIFDVEPHIIHFAGHGTSTGELGFEDILGKMQPIQPAALASLFELVAEYVNCVVLNACYSETQAQAISKYIPYVIGMSKAIGDKESIAFSTGFYRALGAGRPFENAFKFARVEIHMENQQKNIPKHLIPVLYVKNKVVEENLGIESTESNNSDSRGAAEELIGVAEELKRGSNHFTVRLINGFSDQMIDFWTNDISLLDDQGNSYKLEDDYSKNITEIIPPDRSIRLSYKITNTISQAANSLTFTFNRVRGKKLDSPYLKTLPSLQWTSKIL